MARSLRRRAVRFGLLVSGYPGDVTAFITIALILVLTSSSAAQSSRGASDVPRISWGHPDLQGVWVANSATPVERPAALAGRTRLTDEEVAVLAGC